jgi:hypothetical protein
MNLVTCSDDDFQQYAKSVVSMYWRHELMSGVGAVAFGYLGIAYADWFITVLAAWFVFMAAVILCCTKRFVESEIPAISAERQLHREYKAQFVGKDGR